MDVAWVVVADAARARVFRADSRVGPLEEFTDFAHPQSRRQERDLRTDQPGRYMDTFSPNRSAYEERTTPKAYEASVFARELAEFLDRSASEQRYERLVIAAEPAFLGELRERMGTHSRARVALELPKNYSKLRADQLRAHLPERL